MASDFLSTVKAFTELSKKGLTDMPRAVMEEVQKRVKDRTPVATGTLRNGWVLEDLTLSNSVPYAAVVEYGLYPNPPKGGEGKTSGGFSTQSPAGMLGITLVELPQIIEQVKQEQSK